MIKQEIHFHGTRAPGQNPHAWMAQMINYAVTGQFMNQLADQRRTEGLFEVLPSKVLAFPIPPDRDYTPEPAANHGPLPEAA